MQSVAPDVVIGDFLLSVRERGKRLVLVEALRIQPVLALNPDVMLRGADANPAIPYAKFSECLLKAGKLLFLLFEQAFVNSWPLSVCTI